MLLGNQIGQLMCISSRKINVNFKEEINKILKKNPEKRKKIIFLIIEACYINSISVRIRFQVLLYHPFSLLYKLKYGGEEINY